MVTTGMKGAVEALLSSREARRSSLQGLRESVRDARQDEMARQEEAMAALLATLATGRAALKGEAGTLRQEAAEGLLRMCQPRSDQARALHALLGDEARQQRALVQQGLSDQKEQRLGTVSRLHTGLQRQAKALTGEVQKSLRGTIRLRREKGRELFRSLHTAVGGLRQEVGQARSGMQADLAQARAQWQRTGSAFPAQAGLPPRMAATESGPGPVVVEAAPRLAKRIFACLADRPDGIRVKELVEQVGVGRTRVVRALRSLIEEGKIRKEDDLYFAR